MGPGVPAGFAVPGSTASAPAPDPSTVGAGVRTVRPGVVPLRPLTLADILDGAFTTVRRNPRTTLGVALGLALVQEVLVTLAQIAVYAVLPPVRVDPATGEATVGSAALVGQVGPVLGTVVVGSVVGAVLTGMLTVVVTEDVFGRRADLARAWAGVRPVLGRLIVVSLIAGLVPVLGLPLLVAPGVLLWGYWSLAVPALVVERRPHVSALMRSIRLVRGSFWRVWGIRALGVVVTQLVASLFLVPFLVLAAVLGVSAAPTADSAVPLTYLLVTALGTVLATTVSAPLRAGVDAFLYIDQRIRREGLDMAVRLSRLGPPPAGGPR